MFRHFPSSFAWFAAFFAALGTLFFVIGTHTFYRNWQFSGAVLRASGVVTAKNIHVSHGRHGSSTSYTVSYRYFDLDGTGYVSNCRKNGALTASTSRMRMPTTPPPRGSSPSSAARSEHSAGGRSSDWSG